MPLLLQFEMAADSYVLDTVQVAQVLPLLELKALPQAPHGVAGVFNFRGTPVPAIDLSELAVGRAAERCLSTRVIVVHYNHGAGASHLLGLIAERVTRTVKRARSDFVAAGVSGANAPYLGPVAPDETGRLLQWIEVQQLLPAALSAALFRQAEAVS